jgi:hypothetical protein
MILTNVELYFQDRQSMILSKYILKTYYGTYYTLHTTQMFMYRGPTIMRVPRAYEDPNPALRVTYLKVNFGLGLDLARWSSGWAG